MGCNKFQHLISTFSSQVKYMVVCSNVTDVITLRNLVKFS